MLWYTGFLALLSVGVLLMPIGINIKDKTLLLMYFSGTAFWTGAIGTIYMTFKINRYKKSDHGFNELYGNDKQIGLIHFFQNKEAIIMDISMLLSAVFFIIVKIFNVNIFLLYIFFSIFIFTFGMHCMLNGKNYKYIKYISERKKEKD